MNIKHKLLSDYQHTTYDKKIFLIKSGTILENYIYKIKGEEIEVDREIVDANPQYFQPVDWKQELVSYMKSNKIPTPAILSKKLIPFIEEMFVISQSSEKSSIIDDRELRNKIKQVNDRESELEREYRFKVKELGERETELEKEYRTKIKSLFEKESDYETKIDNLSKRESEVQESFEKISSKESEIRKKMNDLREKEESLRDIEFEIGKRERELDKTLLESSKNMDEKQKEMNNKLQLKLKDLEERESKLNQELEDINLKETSLYAEFEKKVKDYEDRYNERIQDLIEKEKDLKNTDSYKFKESIKMLTDYYNSLPWSYLPTDFKSRLESIIIEFTNI